MKRYVFFSQRISPERRWAWGCCSMVPGEPGMSGVHHMEQKMKPPQRRWEWGIERNHALRVLAGANSSRTWSENTPLLKTFTWALEATLGVSQLEVLFCPCFRKNPNRYNHVFWSFPENKFSWEPALWEQTLLSGRKWGQRGGWASLKDNHLGPQPGPELHLAPWECPRLLASTHLSSSCEEHLLKTFKCSPNVFLFPLPVLITWYLSSTHSVWVIHPSATKINEKIETSSWQEWYCSKAFFYWHFRGQVLKKNHRLNAASDDFWLVWKKPNILENK